MIRQCETSGRFRSLQTNWIWGKLATQTCGIRPESQKTNTKKHISTRTWKQKAYLIEWDAMCMCVCIVDLSCSECACVCMWMEGQWLEHRLEKEKKQKHKHRERTKQGGLAKRQSGGKRSLGWLSCGSVHHVGVGYDWLAVWIMYTMKKKSRGLLMDHYTRWFHSTSR